MAKEDNVKAKGSGVAGIVTMTKEQCNQIRDLEDFDLVMLISQIHDHGWADCGLGGATLLKQIIEANKEVAHG